MFGSRLLLKPVALVAGGLLAGGLAVGFAADHDHTSAAATTGAGATTATDQNASEQLLTQAVASTTGSPAAKGHDRAAKGWLRGRLGRLDGRLLHGELVVKTKTGTETLLVQRGVVTAIGSSTVTVRSTDGFTETWVVNSATKFGKNANKDSLAKLKTGDLIALVGKAGSPDPTALALRARTPGARTGERAGTTGSSTNGAGVSDETQSSTVTG